MMEVSISTISGMVNRDNMAKQKRKANPHIKQNEGRRKAELKKRDKLNPGVSFAEAKRREQATTNRLKKHNVEHESNGG